MQKKSKINAQRPIGRPTTEGWPVFDSMDALAAFVPMPLLKQAKKSGCKAFKGSRIYTSDLIPFLFSENRKANQIPEGFATWKEYWDMQKALMEEDKRLKANGDLMSAAEGKRQAARAVAAVLSEMHRMEQEIPPLVEGMSAVEIQKHVKSFHAASRAKWEEIFKRIDEIGE